MLFQALPWRRATAVEEKVVESGEPVAGAEEVGSPTEVSRPPQGDGAAHPPSGTVALAVPAPERLSADTLFYECSESALSQNTTREEPALAGGTSTEEKDFKGGDPSAHVEGAASGLSSPPQDSGPQYPPTRTVALIVTALYLAVFLIALDRTIIATAGRKVPTISDEFDSLGDVGWYASAYFVTSCAFQLVFGRIYTFYSPKWVFLAAIAIFEVGSALCGAAPSSTVFIVGRAIAGLGSAGIISGAIIIIVYTVPLHKRPIYQGIIGAIFGCASVLGPLLGGVFTEHLSWRWCFYINLPIGAVTVLILVFILKLPNPKGEAKSVRQKIAQLDPIGTALFLPGVICLLLALQWGGSVYAWSNARIITLLVLSGVLGTAFIAVQFWKKENATIPPRIIRQRTIAAGFLFCLGTGGALMVLIYYLPIWFQAIQGASAVESGIKNIPLVLSLVVASLIAGVAITKTGYYTPWMIACGCLMSAGAGLVITFTRDTSQAQVMGYQILFGFGVGLGYQQAGIAAQTVLSRGDIPVGVALMFFAQGLGGAVCVSVSQVVFTTRLVSSLRSLGIDAHLIVSTGARNLRNVVPAGSLDGVLVAYNDALMGSFQVGLAVSVFAAVAAALVEWKSVKVAKMRAMPVRAENSA